MDIIVSQKMGRVPITLFQVKGMLNLGSAHQLEQKAQEQYTSGMRYLLIDLSAVESITSAGLRSIQIIYKMLSKDLSKASTGESIGDNDLPKQKSQHLRLLSPQPHIRRVLSISGFDEFFPVYEDKTEAIDSF